MKRLTWILLATLPTIALADDNLPSASTASSQGAAQETSLPNSQLPQAPSSTQFSEPSSSVTPAGLPLSATQPSAISADPAAAVATPTSTSTSAGQATVISADPSATAAAEPAKPVGPRPGGPNKGMLPEEFKVYYSEKAGISKTAFKGGSEKIIPTKNDFTEVPGCYISCYTNDPKKGLYHVGDNTYLIGQIRVSGHYYGGNCLPKGFENKDVRTAKEFKEMCEKDFPEKCDKLSCSVGSNNTAQWFN
ncbi:MAG: hypothetical protein AB7I18_04900 [Candidatus Berkiella sp.]